MRGQRRSTGLGTREQDQDGVITFMESTGETFAGQRWPREHAHWGEGFQDFSLARSRGLGRWLWSGPKLGDHREREEGWRG
jgi:hypothetical protein